MAQYLTKEHLNSEGELDKKTCIAIKRCPHKKKARLNIRFNLGDKAKSSDNSNFVSGLSNTDLSSNSSADNDPLTNAEMRNAWFFQLCAHFFDPAGWCPS